MSGQCIQTDPFFIVCQVIEYLKIRISGNHATPTQNWVSAFHLSVLSIKEHSLFVYYLEEKHWTKWVDTISRIQAAPSLDVPRISLLCLMTLLKIVLSVWNIMVLVMPFIFYHIKFREAWSIGILILPQSILPLNTEQMIDKKKAYLNVIDKAFTFWLHWEGDI